MKVIRRSSVVQSLSSNQGLNPSVHWSISLSVNWCPSLSYCQCQSLNQFVSQSVNQPLTQRVAITVVVNQVAFFHQVCVGQLAFRSPCLSVIDCQSVFVDWSVVGNQLVFGNVLKQGQNNLCFNYIRWIQYNPEITVLKGLTNFDLYWRELLLVGDTYNMVFLQFLQNI